MQPQRSAMERLQELLIACFTVTGFLLIVIAYLPAVHPAAADLARGFGFSLAPAGVVSLIIARFAAKVTETTLHANMDTWRQREINAIGEKLQLGLEETAAAVDAKLVEMVRDLRMMTQVASSAASLGVEGVFRTRGHGLDAMAPAVAWELQEAACGRPSRIWIVASSIKGLLEASTTVFDGEKMLSSCGHFGANLRILVTQPAWADLRASQEGRKRGEIPLEILQNVAYLKQKGVSRDCVRYFPGAPTVFALATSTKMLLNPYPYRAEAFRCFSLVVNKTLHPDTDIYHQYLEYHFEQPWQMGQPVPLDEWEHLQV